MPAFRDQRGQAASDRHLWCSDLHSHGCLRYAGFTLWSGLKFIGKPKAGETVAVAAASGPIGSMVGQLAKLAAQVRSELPAAPRNVRPLRMSSVWLRAVDHRSSSLSTDLQAECPDGVDVYFENVGGHV